MQKLGSQLDSAGVYIGPVLADESPLEKGVFLFPAGAVDYSPPSVPVDFYAQWTGADFSILPLPQPAPPPAPEPLTVEQTIALYEDALDAHLDAVAKADRWRDRFTFAVRAGYENPWQAKAKAFGTWMDDCNARAYALLAAVTAGTTELPTVEDFIAAMPPPPVLL